MITAAIVGGSGYTGGELLRLLIDHPEVDVTQVTSHRYAGNYVYQVHPNLRRRTELKFTPVEELQKTDVLFLALPHGKTQKQIETWVEKADYIIDLSSDFRLRDADLYAHWYGHDHEGPEWMQKFVYGLPELYRSEISKTNYISGVGCNATAANLALLPLVQADLIDVSRSIVIEIKVGSSESGASGNAGSHHAERSNVVRTFSAFGHRHTAEVIQAYGLKDITLTLSSVDLVRGALATAHVSVKPGVTQKDLWKAYRQAVADNPFLRIVKERRGIYRVPEPKILAGSNYADLGFEFNPDTGRVVAICAIDNLMKGASGSAVQSMNLMLGFDETLGLEFPGLHPI
ncbi:MAG: N-acetyl-gamma-glutamyl-phosphate reductase [Chloroflexi bacterium]|nr:MAG: N-acetyl-gamma-glutamyl-phosphate reductase [Chloroflexota bacterium]MBL1193966.1 N-acetyl-gamma-glutamyl-phosphate reductase [Chloroflexota bacterium]NOH11261.1 N-acetyl-gamma-glutamyl-phosphate reductase [Chloroflexota bacterium]